MGALNPNGIYMYDETDNPATFSELLNLGMESVSDRLPVDYSFTALSGSTILPGSYITLDRGVVRFNLLVQRSAWTAGMTATPVVAFPPELKPPSGVGTQKPQYAAAFAGAGTPYLEFCEVDNASGVINAFNGKTGTWRMGVSGSYKL